MALKNDLVLDTSKFEASAVPVGVEAFNTGLKATLDSAQPWYHPDVGPAKFRAMAHEGGSAFPKPVLLDCAVPFSIPSRDAGRSIPCRVIKPEGNPTGVLMHIHGGGWVIGDEFSQDGYLKTHVDGTGVLVISVGYRLAPENPFPAGPNDCYDVAEWLVDNAEKEFGAPLKFIGGESAGAHLTTLSAFHLLSHSNPTYSNFKLKGLLLHFGDFDLSNTPSVHTQKNDPLINREKIGKFIEAFVPDPKADLKHPSISPLYFDFGSYNTVPPAIFTCGTADSLLDDTVFMSAKWQVSGGETVVKFVPGAPHGFFLFPPEHFPGVTDTMEAVLAFMNEKS